MQDHRLRVRQRFSGFYDLPVTDRSTNDIDGANFDATAYVSSLIKNKPLPELVARSNELSLEIKELESDMQMLVYENYNKFISATDTIQEMKNKVDSMEVEMGQLTTSIKEITTASLTINENLADRRVRIQKLNGVRRLLKKLSFIFDLPARLNRAIELDACTEAVRYWMSSGVVLDAYGDVPAFRAVKEEAEQVMGRLRKKLADRLESADTCREDLHEAASLLLQLKEPRDALLRRYLSVREKRLHASVKATVDAWAAPKTGAAAGSVRSDDEAGLLSMRVLEEAKDCLLSFNDLLPTALGDKAAVGARPEDEAGEETGEGAGGGAKEEAEKGRSGGVMGDVVEAVGRCLDAYWRALRTRGEAGAAEVEGADAAAVRVAMEALYDAAQCIDAVAPKTGASAAAEAALDAVARRRIRGGFEGALAAVETRARELASSRGGDSAEAAAAAAAAASWAVSAVEEQMEAVRRLAGAGGVEGAGGQLMGKLRGGLVAHGWAELLRMLRAWERSTGAARTAVLAAAGKKEAPGQGTWGAEEAGLLRVCRMALGLAEAVPKAAGAWDGGGRGGEGGHVSAGPGPAEACCGALRRIADAQLQGLAECRGRRLAAVLCDPQGVARLAATAAVDRSRSTALATALSAHVLQTAGEVLAILGEAVFDDSRRDDDGPDREGEVGAVRAGVERSAGDAVGAACAWALRSLKETVRCLTLTTPAYQQLQLDLHVLVRQLRKPGPKEPEPARAAREVVREVGARLELVTEGLMAEAAQRSLRPAPLTHAQLSGA